MGTRERRELINQLKILLAHLLKWHFQSHRQSRSWAATIKEQRLSIQDLLDDNPSLRGIPDQQITKAYRLARLVAGGRKLYPIPWHPSDSHREPAIGNQRRCSGSAKKSKHTPPKEKGSPGSTDSAL